LAKREQLAAQNDILAYSALVNDIAYEAKSFAITEAESSIEQGSHGWDASERKKRIDGVCIYVVNERKNQR
jgi:hypothetical protein